MIWVIQENIFKEKGHEEFIKAIMKSGVDYTIVKVVPFSHEISPAITYSGKKIAFGSTTLMKITLKEGWNPGCYFNENFDAKIWLKAYGENCLNFESVVCQLKDVNFVGGSLFMRPCADLKQFTGKVFNEQEFIKWKSEIKPVSEGGYSTITPETWVAVAKPKKVFEEYRLFVVGGKVVTGSIYKIATDVIAPPLPMNENVWNFAQDMVDIWIPHKVFVIDIACTEEGLKVIEINCANSSGFYNCDVSKFVQEICELEE